MIIRGQCHCGNISYELETRFAEPEISARACDCGFCRMHAARNWSDPNGRVTISVEDSGQLHRYRFALKTADFFICKTCGTYLGAVLNDPDGCWSTVNLRLSDLAEIPESASSYGAENAESRISRRKVVWTPTHIVELTD